jgi:hypothetical protein
VLGIHAPDLECDLVKSNETYPGEICSWKLTRPGLVLFSLPRKDKLKLAPGEPSKSTWSEACYVRK